MVKNAKSKAPARKTKGTEEKISCPAKSRKIGANKRGRKSGNR
ncbi:MAG: hypothetical protein ACYTF1_27560 [Planctomycetota bacterium]